MSLFEPLTRQVRYAAGVAKFLREPVSREEGLRVLERQVAMREANFLALLEGIYANPQSPYQKLLRHAGFELPQLQAMVRERGIEATLRALYDGGVYVTSDEMKGRAPIRRPGIEIATKATDFDNPLTQRGPLRGQTSGSTGAAVEQRNLFSNVAERIATSIAVGWGDTGRPEAFWTGSPVRMVRQAKSGGKAARFFSTMPFSWDGSGMQVIGAYVASRIAGRPLPWPRFVARDNAIVIARWLASMTAKGTPGVLHCHASPAIRVCLAAREAGLDISGASFLTGGEPITPGKAEVIQAAGANYKPGYSLIELGFPVGVGCENPVASDDMHLITAAFAMIPRSRPTSTGEDVSALVYTALLPDAPKLLLNWDSGDYAYVDERDCGCQLYRLGFKTHIAGVQSYDKLTSEGVTFSGTRLYDLVERELPHRFGGAMGDYQLVEEEEDGLPRVRIVVSPRVGRVDEAALIASVMAGLESSHAGAGGREMTDQWRQGGTLQVVRREPEMTRTMKVLPLRVMRPQAPARESAD